MPKHIVIFASGTGTNAENIIQNFHKGNDVKVVAVVCNKKEAAVMQKAAKLGVPCVLIDQKKIFDSDKFISFLQSQNVSLIVLAGFLWLLPERLIKAFDKKIINVHPSLLPKHGGKGMYGANVHKAVLQNNDSESGITVHFVNEHFDEGEIIMQQKCKVEKGDSVDSLAARIHELEYVYFPKAIEAVLAKQA